MNTFKLNRREFLSLAGVSGSGLLLATSTFALTGCKSTPDKAKAIAHELNVFVAINTDNTIDIVTHRSEMGQGSRTGIPQIIADELEADWQQVNVIQGLGDKRYGNQNTDGSSSIRMFWEKLREVGASARTMLEQTAADVWGVSLSEVEAKKQQVINKKTGKVLNYGYLADLASKQAIPDVSSLTFKRATDFNYIGKPVPIVDLKDMTTGNTTYGVDVELPGMVIASIERCPVLHGEVKSFDATKALAVPGVVDVIEMPKTPANVVFFPLNGIAVLATNTWAAMKGREALTIEWELGENKNHDSEKAFVDFAKALKSNTKQVGKKGNAVTAIKKASKVIDAQYQVPYLVHAPMEPPMATAWFHDDICEVWAATQDPQKVMAHGKKISGFSEDKIKVNVTLLGGAFGRKAKPDFTNEAIYLAQKTNKPVKVVWSREDDIRNGYFHAGSVEHMQAGVDSTGKITGWAQQIAYPSITSTWNAKSQSPAPWELGMGFANLPFDIDNVLMQTGKVSAPVRIGWMRSVCNIQQAFGLNCFIDEIAHATGQKTAQLIFDTVGEDRNINFKKEFNYKYFNYGEKAKRHPYSTKRYKGVLANLLTKVNIDEELPEGQGWGIAVHSSFVSYVAVATKVEVINGDLKVKEIHCAIDCGQVINPDRVQAQMEGSMIFGMSIALMGEINIKGGAVVQSNFHDFPLTRMNQTPDIQVYLVNPGENLPAGVGEPGVPPVAPSIANAVFAATGKRYRTLPLSKHLDVGGSF